MKKSFKIYVRLSLVLLPIFMWPWSADPFSFGKVVLAIMMGMVGLVWWALNQVIYKEDKVKFNQYWLLMLGLFGWGGYSFFARVPLGIRARTLVEPVGMGLLAAVTIWMFLWLQIKNEEETRKQWDWLTVTGVLVAVSSLVVFLIPTAKLPFVFPKENPLLVVGAANSMTGSLMAEVVLLLLLVVEWVSRSARKIRQNESYLATAVLTGFLGLVTMLDVYRIIKLGWVTMDLVTAWSIAVEAFKRSPVFGSGIGTFLEGFMALRPASYNLTKFWSANFNSSSSGLLQLWTELGGVGLGIVVVGVLGVIKNGKKYFSSWFEVIKAVIVIVSVLFFPLTWVTVFLAAWWVVSLVKVDRVASIKLKLGEMGVNVAPVVLLILLVVTAGVVGFYEMAIVKGEYFFRKSIIAASKNDGVGAYNFQIKAIASNENMADYHKTYSQTNSSLALILLQNKDISDDDKQKASVLIQQSVREAKAAIALNNFNAEYWSNLAGIYKRIIGLVDGAPDWSLQAYSQAVALDPTNPLIKMEMGGLLFAATSYDAADRVFEQVIANKSDFANGWYNWAYTAKNTNRLGDAIQRLTQAVALVPKDSADYDKASKELEVWTKEYNDAVKKQAETSKTTQNLTPTPTGTLRTAEPLPTVNKQEKVNVPVGELQPPKDVVTPTPTVTPTVTK